MLSQQNSKCAELFVPAEIHDMGRHKQILIWKYQLLYCFSIINFERKELNDMNTQRRENGTVHINKGDLTFDRKKCILTHSWTSFGRAKNYLFSKQIFFLCKIVLDLVADEVYLLFSYGITYKPSVIKINWIPSRLSSDFSSRETPKMVSEITRWESDFTTKCECIK